MAGIRKRFRDYWKVPEGKESLIVSAILVIILVGLEVTGTPLFETPGIEALAAIIFTVIVFHEKMARDAVKKRDNQLVLLRSLSNYVKETRKMMGGYQDSRLPFYAFPLPETVLYREKLDSSIDDVPTADLKHSIGRVEDKLRIVNYMVERMQVAFNEFLESEEVEMKDINADGELRNELKNKFKTDNKTFAYYRPKINKILTDMSDEEGLPYNLCEIRVITQRILEND